MQTLKSYYATLAPDYDRLRFANSYGRHVDQLERAVLDEWLADVSPQFVLDLGCGTGRFLDFALTGIDQSAEMLAVAATKHPDRHLIHASFQELPQLCLQNYRAVICLHVFMHCEEREIAGALQALARSVEPGGQVIMDIPSQYRRRLFHRPASENDWHGKTAATLDDVLNWCGSAWRVAGRRGILVLPLHRIPRVLRPFLRGLDAWLGRSWLARFASYHLYRLERCT